VEWKGLAMHEALTLAAAAEPEAVNHGTRYSDLRRLVVDSGLLDKALGFYFLKIFANLFLLAIGIAVLFHFRVSWVQIPNCVFLAFVFTQMGFIVHDSGHQQIFNSNWKNQAVGILHANLLLGFSSSWWNNTHNRHHKSPNQLDADPDIDFLVLAFSEDQAKQKRGLARFIVKYQAYFFFPLLLLEVPSLKFESWRYLLRNKVEHPIVEWTCMLANYVVCAAVLVKCLGIGWAILFAICHQAIFGVFLGLVFVTNHKGMPLLEKETAMDFLERQVITARNIRGAGLIDYLYGGLSCQVEHHLFPNIPLTKLRKAQQIVRSYCESHGLEYYETGVARAYFEVLVHLHEVGASLRAVS
jgi:fatty acid desaturase